MIFFVYVQKIILKVFNNGYFLLMEAGSHMFLGYIMKSRWKHGRKWWMQFMPKVPSFSANCGMSAVHLIKVPIYLSIWKLMLYDN